MKSPLYKQIKQQIEKDIRAGVYPVESLLPSENELAQTYEVSRITSKRALNDLENDGLIYRKRGIGSFVQKLKPKHDILFISPFADSQSFGNYTQGILEALQDSSYRLQLQQNDLVHLESLTDWARDYAGIIFYPFHSKDLLDFVFPLYQLTIPIVILDKELAGVPLSSVISNNFQGGYEATRHLINLKLDTIAFLSADAVDSISSVRERYFGYLKALSDYQLTCSNKPLIYDIKSDMFLIIKHLVESGVQGIVCENDIIAIQLMNALKKEGFHLPQDFKIIGFDNTQAAALMDPPLSTIQQNFSDIGRLATKHLIELIEKEDTPISRQVVDVSLVVRESTQTLKEDL